MSDRQTHLIDEIKALPEEALNELEAFLRTLKARISKRSKRILYPGGLWERYGPVTEGEINRWRKEMWGNFGKRAS